MIMAIDIRTTIMHYKKLINRKVHIQNQMKSNNFTNYSFYEDYDSNELTDEMINEYYNSFEQNPENWSKKVSLWGSSALNYHNKKCNIAEISVTIKFGKTLQIMKQLNDEMFITFDDDVILCNDFENKFYEYLKKTPSDWDAIYFGSGAGLKPEKIIHDQFVYLKSHPASRCLDSVLLKNKTVKDLSNTWFPFSLISDWEIGYQHFLHNHKVYWWEPGLVLQGSENGLFQSAVKI